MKRTHPAILAAFALALIGTKAQAQIPPKDPARIAQVAAGTVTTANAAWWGFDENDATKALQQAINSKATTVIVPNLGKPWIVSPITLHGDQTLFFAPGTVIAAKKGAFRGKTDSLFRATGKNNIKIEGYNATFRMNKADYTAPPYDKAEWRNALVFDSCDNILVEGLHIQDSGGDGIYIGGSVAAHPFCSNVVIQGVNSDNNLRQGISVVSAKNIRIAQCTFQNTYGTPPAAGIDFEPNQPVDFLSHCLVDDCVFSGNQGAGVAVWLATLNTSSPLVSIQVSNCRILKNMTAGISVGAISDQGPGGHIIFSDCQVANEKGPGIVLWDKSSQGAVLRFENCKWTDVAQGSPDTAPILLKASQYHNIKAFGNVQFAGCSLNDRLARPIVRTEGRVTGTGFFQGNLNLINRNAIATESLTRNANALALNP